MESYYVGVFLIIVNVYNAIFPEVCSRYYTLNILYDHF
ncbi:Uncharacterised protein [Sphingobacterium spiritivorum]|uniref:Uncharacterized protein n=1 Tax=Sphingobacterium spiritivorum TaxID=258 RepID=A0A380CNG4_SPHSI|nr:Uncharacterised protein [Sphingobacterium spiritivorum]